MYRIRREFVNQKPILAIIAGIKADSLTNTDTEMESHTTEWVSSKRISSTIAILVPVLVSVNQQYG